MDTLEYRGDEKEGGWSAGRPIIWWDKTPQEVCREQHPDCTLRQDVIAPKPLGTDSQYCDVYSVCAPADGDGPFKKRAKLIPLPGKPRT